MSVLTLPRYGERAIDPEEACSRCAACHKWFLDDHLTYEGPDGDEGPFCPRHASPVPVPDPTDADAPGEEVLR